MLTYAVLLSVVFYFHAISLTRFVKKAEYFVSPNKFIIKIDSIILIFYYKY